MRFLQQHSQPGCRFIKPDRQIFQDWRPVRQGRCRVERPAPLALTPLTRRVLPCVCVCLTIPFSFTHSQPRCACMHTASSCHPSQAQLAVTAAQAFSRVLLLCSLSPRFPALRLWPRTWLVSVCLPSHCSFLFETID